MKKINTDVGLLLLRIAGFFMAFGHGLGKMPPSDGLIKGVGEMGFPLPAFFAWAAALSEFGGGLLIGIGLFTRPSALFLIFTMSTAAFIRHADDPYGTKEKAFLFLVIGACLLFTGAGKYSLGRVIFRNDNPLLQ